MNENDQMRVAIVGATGAVGQQLVTCFLERHPNIALHLVASAKSAGLAYKDAISYWTQDEELSKKTGEKIVHSLDEPIDAAWIFSALPSKLAAIYEPLWLANGKRIISMASPHRLLDQVPTVVKDVNESHLEPALSQMRSGKGALICKPNCAAAILATFIKPLITLGIPRVSVVSLQSLSGAGYPGPSAWQMASDFIGHIEGEAAKIEQEMPRLLGEWKAKESCFTPLESIEWSVTSMRVPVMRGHSLQLEIEFEKEVSQAEFKQILSVSYLSHIEDYNQLTPKRVMARASPMQVYWGNHRLKKATRHQVLVIGDNLGRGAATGAVDIWHYCQGQLN